MCSSYDHNITSCPSYTWYVQPNSSFPLAKCTGFEVDEPFGLVAKFDVDAAYCELEDTYDVVHNLVETPLAGVMICMCIRGLLALVLIMCPLISLIIQVFPLCVHNLHLPPSIICNAPILINVLKCINF